MKMEAAGCSKTLLNINGIAYETTVILWFQYECGILGLNTVGFRSLPPVSIFMSVVTASTISPSTALVPIGTHLPDYTSLKRHAEMLDKHNPRPFIRHQKQKSTIANESGTKKNTWPNPADRRLRM
jgi:hypothetical protein